MNDINNRSKGQNIEIEALRLSSDGAGVGYDDNGMATFVPGLLPGEKGLIEITERKKRWQRGELQKILKSSPERVDPPCKVFSVCGGCQLQHLNYKETLNWKRRWVEDSLKRIGKIEVDVNPVLGMENPWRYRNKARLHISSKGELGYFKEKTNATVVFPDCLLLSEQMNRWIKETEEVFWIWNKGQREKTSMVKGVTWRENSKGEGMLIVDGDISGDDLKMLRFSGKVKSIVSMHELSASGRFVEENRAPAVENVSAGLKNLFEEKKTKEDYLIEEIMGLIFRVSPLAFLQVNPTQTKVLYAKVFEFASLSGTEKIWDLYCGIGTITLALASRCQEVIGIEENPYAVQDAKINTALNRLENVTFIEGKTEERIKDLRERGSAINPDIIVLDPPRAGVDAEAINEIIKAEPKRIVYVSCDPGTLARDLGNLVAGGYEVKTVQPVDMFPWTMHVETVVLMSRLEK